MILKNFVTRFNSEVHKGMKIAMVSRLLKVFPIDIITVSMEWNILFPTRNYVFYD